MKCPECFEEVMSGDADCPYCGAYLGYSSGGSQHVTLVTVCDEQEALCLRDLLENQGISARIVSYASSSSLYGDSDDWGEITVPEDSVEFADSIVNSYMKGASGPVPAPMPADDLDDDDQENEDEL